MAFFLLTMHILLITRAKKSYIAKIVAKGTHFVTQVLPPTFWAIICRKCLKIPKGQSESVYRRRTDNTIAKRKSTKGQTTINKTLHIKLKIE